MVNQDTSGPAGAAADQSVSVGAANDYKHLGIVVGIAGGFVAVSAGADISVLKAKTLAYVDDGGDTPHGNLQIHPEINHQTCP